MGKKFVVIDCGKVLRRVHQCGYGVGELATSLSVSRTTVWKLTGGQGPQHRSRLDVAQRLASKLDVHLETLFEAAPANGKKKLGWIGEYVISESESTAFQAEVVRRPNKLWLQGHSEAGRLQFQFDVQEGVHCGYGRIKTAGWGPTLFAVWGRVDHDHQMTFEGVAAGDVPSQDPIVIFVRRQSPIAPQS